MVIFSYIYWPFGFPLFLKDRSLLFILLLSCLFFLIDLFYFLVIQIVNNFSNAVICPTMLLMGSFNEINISVFAFTGTDFYICVSKPSISWSCEESFYIIFKPACCTELSPRFWLRIHWVYRSVETELRSSIIFESFTLLIF